MNNNIKNEKNKVTDHNKSDGFIEITSLELLDQLVGGFISSEEVYCSQRTTTTTYPKNPS